MGEYVATYAKNALAYTFGPKIWEDSITILMVFLCYYVSKGVHRTNVMCQKVCIEPVLIFDRICDDVGISL